MFVWAIYRSYQFVGHFYMSLLITLLQNTHQPQNLFLFGCCCCCSPSPATVVMIESCVDCAYDTFEYIYFVWTHKHILYIIFFAQNRNQQNTENEHLLCSRPFCEKWLLLFNVLISSFHSLHSCFVIFKPKFAHFDVVFYSSSSQSHFYLSHSELWLPFIKHVFRRWFHSSCFVQFNHVIKFGRHYFIFYSWWWLANIESEIN